MSGTFKAPSKTPQSNDTNTPEKKNTPLKLVVSNSTPTQKQPLPQTRNPNTGFIAEVRKRGQSYTLIASDPFHRLDCEIALEVCDDEDKEELKHKAVVCHFPNILAEELNDFVEEDETLYGMILVQFQMKLLEQLLLFTSDQDAANLLIWIDNASEGHALGIYRSLVTYEDRIPTITGLKTQLVIPTTLETFDKLMDLMDHVNQNFRQMLWGDQSANPAIRNYLKSNP